MTDKLKVYYPIQSQHGFTPSQSDIVLERVMGTDLLDLYLVDTNMIVMRKETVRDLYNALNHFLMDLNQEKRNKKSQ